MNKKGRVERPDYPYKTKQKLQNLDVLQKSACGSLHILSEEEEYPGESTCRYRYGRLGNIKRLAKLVTREQLGYVLLNVTNDPQCKNRQQD